MVVEEHVRVIFEAISKGTEKVLADYRRTQQQIQKNVQAVQTAIGRGTGFDKASLALDRLRESGFAATLSLERGFLKAKPIWDKFYRGMARDVPNLPLDRINSMIGNMNYQLINTGRGIAIQSKLSGQFVRQAHVTKQLRQQTQRFHMELLSVGFGAAMVAGIMWSLLAPAMKMTGIFELLNLTLAVFFLPIVLALMEALLPILSWFMELPEPVKFAIGAIVLFGAVLFSLLSFIGFIGLFAFSFKAGLATIGLMFGGLKKFLILGLAHMKAAFVSFTAFLAANPIVLIIMAIIAAVLLLNEMWKYNWFGIRQHVGNFVKWFAGVYDSWIKPVLKVIGTGLIFLKNVIIFAITHAGAIWDSIWLSMYVGAAKIWNMILSGVQWWVNLMLKPIQILYDGIKAIAGFVGIEMPEIKFEVDLTSWMAQTEEAEKKLLEVNKTLQTDFGKAMKDTAIEVNNWNTSLDAATGAMEDMGDQFIEEGKAIDAGTAKGKGFLGGFAVSDLWDTGEENIEKNSGAMDGLTGQIETSQDAFEGFKNQINNETIPTMKDWETLLGETKTKVDELTGSVNDFTTAIHNVPASFSAPSITGSVSIPTVGVGPTIKAAVEKGMDVMTGVSERGIEKAMENWGFKAKGFTDFVWRSGSPPIAFSPGDTIVGTKAGMGGFGNITFAPTINIEASSNVDIERLKTQLSSEWVEELKSMTRRV